jgi:hypothetical protein
MPTPTIPDGELFMNATLYTGNGASRSITNGAPGASFQPDFIWIKSRSTADYHNLNDIVRGIVGTGSPNLFTNRTEAEATFTGFGVSALNSNGFNLIGNGSYTNASGTNYVAWQWKAGGAAVTNTAGSISAQVSANTTSGFSVVTYTGNATSGATVGHGLGVAPSFIIAKSRTQAATDWPTYHISTGNNGGCTLNEALAKVTTAIWWNNTTPSSTVFTLGNGAQTNGNTQSMVAYCWAPVAGYSAFGSYTGNGSTDGPFVYLGFRPKFLLIKRTDAGRNWFIYDTSRSPYNETLLELAPNLANAEATSTGSLGFDLLSNGFKLRTNQSAYNESTATYIYAAFAENPLKYANAR